VLNSVLFKFFMVLVGLGATSLAWASGDAVSHTLGLTNHIVGFAALGVFTLAYGLVMAEEQTHLRKSKPVIVAAGIIWILIAAYCTTVENLPVSVESQIRHNFLEFAELMMFLLVAMTYINAMEERQVSDALRTFLVKKGFSFRQLFWLTGILAFFISPVADNLTTALLMCAVVLAVGASSPRFVSLACINIVVAANAGGAFSPFGDITTLMVWQKGVVEFSTFFALFLPSMVNFLVPAAIMHFAIPQENPAGSGEDVVMKVGAKRIIVLFLVTIATAVSFHNVLHLPPVYGMMTGLGFLQLFGYFLKMKEMHAQHKGMPEPLTPKVGDIPFAQGENKVEHAAPFDVFQRVARAEWDTLLFFYGVILCVGGLGFLGYLELASNLMYCDLGPTTANVLVGMLSAIVDNIPVVFAVLTMLPAMDMGQWLLVTLTAGVGGSMLSVGSAAGVALMGAARGQYTFFSHLKWMPVIALGYVASIFAHQWVNASMFDGEVLTIKSKPVAVCKADGAEHGSVIPEGALEKAVAPAAAH